jgi:glycosyltransferase involved in cell wall biosynthesis
MYKARIGVNEYVNAIGLSGSTFTTEQLKIALEELNYEVVQIRPNRIPKAKVLKLAHMIYWDLLRANQKSRKSNCQLIIHPANTGITAKDIPTILILHDTMVLDFPDFFTRGFRTYAKYVYGFSVRKAKNLLTPSEFSRNAILERWPGKRAQILHWPIRITQGKSSKCERDPYKILWVGSLDSHKRFFLALETVRILRKESGENYSLLAVVRSGNQSNEIQEFMNQNVDLGWVTLQSDVSDETLAEYYNRSIVLLHTAISEGFCLPVLEAMYFGLPVVHCNIPALLELYGEMRHSKSPDDSNLIARNLREILNSDSYWKDESARITLKARDYRFEIFVKNVEVIMNDIL